MNRRARAVSCLLLAACACAQADKEQHWGSGYGPDFCVAAEDRSQFVAVQLSRLRGWSGIAIGARAFDRLPPEDKYAELGLEIAGQPVRASAAASGEGADKGALFFAFNPRPILIRHPDGFDLVVKRNGRPIHAASLHGAADAFTAVRECDSRRMMGRDPSSRPRE